MNLKKILTAAAAAITLTVAGMSAANAEPYHGYGHHDSDRGDHRGDRFGRDDHRGRFDRDDTRFRRVVEHRVIFNTLRARHIRYVGTPYFVRGHYVVRSFDRFGRVTFVEVNPYTGGYVGFIRL